MFNTYLYLTYANQLDHSLHVTLIHGYTVIRTSNYTILEFLITDLCKLLMMKLIVALTFVAPLPM